MKSMDELNEIVTEIRAQGDALQAFQKKHEKRVDALDERLQVLGDEIKNLKINGAGDARIDALIDEVKILKRPGSGGGSRLDMSTGTPEERKALEGIFRAWLGGDTVQLSQAVSAFGDVAGRLSGERKDMRVGVDPAGGWLVHPVVSDTLLRIRAEVSPFMAATRQITLESGTEFEEIVDRNLAAAEWVSETQPRNETATPDLVKLRIALAELHAQPAVTQKLLDTSSYDIVGWLIEKIAEAFAVKQSDAVFHGDGVGKPRGILMYPTAATGDKTRAWGTIQHIATGQSGAWPSSDPGDVLIDMAAALKPQYRRGAVWLMNRTTAAYVRKMKAGTADQYLWQPGLQAGQPDMLLGYPVMPAEEMPDASANSLSVALANPAAAYTVIRRPGIRLLVDPYTAKPFVKLYSVERMGGDVVNFEAIKLLKFSGS